jgi:sulfide:quinone oxidoreductase
VADTKPPATYGGLRVLIAGGGVAALEAMFALRALAGDRVDIELLTAEPRFLYRPLSVRVPFGGAAEPMFETAELAEAADAAFSLGELVSIAPERSIARTSHGTELEYDALLVACGARPRTGFPGAVTFRGPADCARVELVVDAVARGIVRSVLFVVPDGPTRPLPIYELAFQLRARSVRASITIATAESAPLAELGQTASGCISDLLEKVAIELRAGQLIPHGDADAVIAAPLLEGRRVLGLPCDDDGFVATDGHGRVLELEGVYAAGDVTDYPVKHGSIAAEQADTAAAAIAARAGASVVAQPFHPVLRAELLLGDQVLYARRDLDDPHDPGAVSHSPLWAPPAKIAARYLAPALARFADRPGHRLRSSIFAPHPT